MKNKKARLSEIASRLYELSPKIDSGRYKYSEKQEQCRLVDEYIRLDHELEELKGEESPNSKKASKISALISQMERHQNLNKEDMPLVVEILKRELDFLNRLEGNK